MNIKSHSYHGVEIVEIISDALFIEDAVASLDLLGNLYYQGFDKIILHQKNLTAHFFDLKNGLAGEMLQKYSNYRVKLAIVGDFSIYTGKSIRDFIVESNRNGQISFVSSADEALRILSGNKPG